MGTQRALLARRLEHWVASAFEVLGRGEYIRSSLDLYMVRLSEPASAIRLRPAYNGAVVGGY